MIDNIHWLVGLNSGLCFQIESFSAPQQGSEKAERHHARYKSSTSVAALIIPGG
jgi:hypothetical protein